MRSHRIRILAVMLLVFCFITSPFAEDWKQWRYDAYRSANSPETLPKELHLQWVREYPQLQPVWDDPLNHDLMQYDTIYEPIVYDGMVYVGSNASDRVVAIDVENGKEQWAFYTDGPVRFPPSAQDGKVYFISDDGHLYCVDAKDGSQIWKFNSVLSDRKVIGNERLVSTWSARGGQVVKDGVVYFGSGIWPFMGVFLFAVDAQTGKEIWVNDSRSAPFVKQPHNSPSFAGIAPQGALVATKDRLLVPGGRSVPASFDLHTGEYQYYQLASSGKTGGAFVAANDDYFVNYHRDHVTHLYDLATGERAIAELGKVPVIDDRIFYCKGSTISAKQIVSKEFQKRERNRETGESEIITETRLTAETLWEVDADGQGELIKAGNYLYAGGKGVVTAIDIETQKITWQAHVDGDVKRIIAANGKLFAVTIEGKIYAFGAEKKEPIEHLLIARQADVNPASIQKANDILEQTGIRDGYALAYHVQDSHTLEAIVRHSGLRLSVVDSDPQKINTWRKHFVESGLHGKRISFKQGNIDSFNAPPYVFSMIYVGDAGTQNLTREDIAKLYGYLRPYGGTLCIAKTEQTANLAKNINDDDLANAEITTTENQVLIVREGALPGAADWTHQYGNVANTIKSDDSLVKLPLGILWYGGSSNTDVLPRHGHAPPQQVVGGRMFIEGMNSMNARDVYTGRVLWQRTFDDLDNFGVYYDETYKDTPLDTAYNQIHIPGANARGTNYVVTEDRIYLVKQDHCLVMDTATGKDIMKIYLPEFENSEEKEDWGYVGVYEDFLIAGAGFVSYMDFVDIPEDMREKRKVFMNFDITSSKRLVVMDRMNGEVKWTFDSELGFNHNAIVAGDGKLYCIDKMPPAVEDALRRRGMDIPGTPKVFALDIKTGNEIWSKDEHVFGTWLGYSDEYGIVLQAGRPSRDMLYGDKGEGMIAYRAKSGDELWMNQAKYNGPCILYHDQIITDEFAYSLTSGEQIMRKNPLTGEETPWAFQRNHGCDSAIASEYFMTFRSASAGFYDLESDGGTGNFGGFKSSCTSNLIVANGILNAPDYTRTCSCSYQNQTSLAMIHDPDVEMWTFNEFQLDDEAPIQQIGINLGAPGDRRTDNGTLWLDYPIVGGPSPDLSVTVEPESAEWFLHHSSRVSGEGPKWIEASGVKGAQKIALKLTPSPDQKQAYTVRLYFMDPNYSEAGKRVFDVALQGNTVINGLDIAQEAGGVRRGIVKEFKDIEVIENLVIELSPTQDSEDKNPVLSGIEVIAKNRIAQK